MSYYVSVGKNYFRAVIDAIDGLDKAKKALGSKVAKWQSGEI